MGRGDFGAFRISLNACEREGGLIKDRGLFGNDRLVLLIGQTGHAIGWQ